MSRETFHDKIKADIMRKMRISENEAKYEMQRMCPDCTDDTHICAQDNRTCDGLCDLHKDEDRNNWDWLCVLLFFFFADRKDITSIAENPTVVKSDDKAQHVCTRCRPIPVPMDPFSPNLAFGAGMQKLNDSIFFDITHPEDAAERRKYEEACRMCPFCAEEHDMGATIPVCTRDYSPCDGNCAAHMR